MLRATQRDQKTVARNNHRSQNRIESWHQLRSTIAQVGGKKELTGQNDIELEISNQCGRLLSIIIITQPCCCGCCRSMRMLVTPERLLFSDECRP
ncbi:Tn3 family transposase [Xenorhabdus sp. PB61.4]|nr:Tn3 family transposase [Xenorhabdus sp. PB61.4]